MTNKRWKREEYRTVLSLFISLLLISSFISHRLASTLRPSARVTRPVLVILALFSLPFHLIFPIPDFFVFLSLSLLSPSNKLRVFLFDYTRLPFPTFPPGLPSLVPLHFCFINISRPFLPLSLSPSQLHPPPPLLTFPHSPFPFTAFLFLSFLFSASL